MKDQRVVGYPTDEPCPLCGVNLIGYKDRDVADTMDAYHTVCDAGGMFMRNECNLTVYHAHHYSKSKTAGGWVDMSSIGPFDITRCFRNGGDENVIHIFKTGTLVQNKSVLIENFDHCLSDEELAMQCNKYRKLLCLT